jgi:hypothetical protein
MTTHGDEPGRDGEWSRLLRRWTTPPRRMSLDDRVMAGYRVRASGPLPWWRAFLGMSVRGPLPLALVVLLVAVVSTVMAVRKTALPVAPPAVAEPARPSPAGDRALAATSLDLDGFQAAAEVKITIVSRGSR